MKRHLLALALGMACTSQAATRAEVFDQLAPSPAPAVTSTEQALQQHPTLAAIPSNVSALLHMPQFGRSVLRLQSIMPSMDLPSDTRQLFNMIGGVSLALGEEGSQQLSLVGSDLLYLSLWSGTIDTLGPDRVALLRGKIAEKKARLAQTPLPTLYLVGQLSDELIGQLQGALGMYEMQLIQPSTPKSFSLNSNLSITELKPFNKNGYSGFSFTLNFFGINKPYSVIYKVTGNQICLIATPEPQSVPLPASPEQSLAGTDYGQTIGEKQDFHFYSQDGKILANLLGILTQNSVDNAFVAKLQGVEIGNFKDEMSQSHVAQNLLTMLLDFLPQSEGIMRGSINLSGEPQLEARWTGGQYRFSEAALLSPNAIERPELEAYVESSPFSYPDLSESFASMRQAIDATKDGQDDLVAFDAIQAYMKTWTGQSYYAKDNKQWISFTKHSDAQQASEQLNIALKAEETDARALYHTGKDGVLCADDGMLNARFQNGQDGKKHAGLRFMFKLPFGSPFGEVYGRWSMQGKESSFKMQLKK